MGSGPIPLAKFDQTIDAHNLAEQLGAVMADFPRRLDGREAILRATLYGVVKIAGETEHGDVGDLDTAETVLAAQLDAAAEMIVSGDHPSA